MAPRINIPPVTRMLLIGLVTLTLLYNIARWRQLDHTPGKASSQQPLVPYLTIVPAKVLWYPWTLISATFVEQNIFTLLINGATIFYGGKYLERAWGSREFGKFILVVSLIPNIVIVPFYLLWSAVGGSSSTPLTTICGGISIQASFLVAFKQLVPEHTVTILKGIVKMRVKHFPALFLLLNTIGGFILGTDTACLLTWLGLLTSWTYLRFYKYQPDLSGTSTNGLGIKGDASETFAFANLFPDRIQPPIAFVADQIYIVLVSLKICTPFSAEEIASGNEQAIARGEAGLPSLLNNGQGMGGSRGIGRREEAERRRAIALKALDQRLQAASAGRMPSPATRGVSPKPQQPQTVAPAVAPGQNMLGETSYTPEQS